MKILVTGAAGFIGYHLAKQLIDLGYSVVGLDNINEYYDVQLKYKRLAETGINRNAIKYGEILKSEKHKNYDFIQLNLEDRDKLAYLFKKENFSIVCNLAAQAGVRYSIENPYSYIDSNIVGFLNILECCRHNAIKHFIYASSSSVYGNSEKVPFSEDDRTDAPVSLYAATKKANELMAHTYSYLYKLQTTGLRFFTVYGPWGRPDMAPMLFAKAIIDSEPIRVFNNGNLKRDFTYIDDIIKGLLKVIQANLGNTSNNELYRILNIGCSNPVELMDFITILEMELEMTAQLEMYPMQAGDVNVTFSDVSKLKKFANYQPETDLKSGIKKFIDWFKYYYQGK